MIKIQALSSFGIFWALLAPQALATLYNEMSDFEREAVNEGMVLHNLEAEFSPQGKLIDKIYIVTEPPFSKKAGFLSALDRLHIDTKESVIRSYLFFTEGKPYEPSAIKDSELYLRRLEQVRSLAIIVPAKSKDEAPDKLDILVVTRDIMSLRPSINFSANKNIITDFGITLGEHNLLGYNKSISAIYELKQPMHVFSLRYFDPKVLGSRYELVLKPSLVFERRSLKLDGFLGEFEFKKPLISRDDKWGYGLEAQFGSKPVIDFSGEHIRFFYPPEIALAKPIERRYRWRYGQSRAQLRRSFGTNDKKELFVGHGLNIKKPLIPADLNLSAAQEESFKKNVLPRNEIESFVTLGASYFQDRYMSLYDYNNFKLQETKRMGPALSLSNDFALKGFLGSDNNFLRPEVKISYMQALFKQSFVYVSFFTSNRYDTSWQDNTLKSTFTFVSPILPKLGRLVVDAQIVGAFNNRDNLKYVLGADSGLRGVTSRYYLGSRAFRANVELRTLPLDLWITHVGVVFFYDVGSAFDELSRANSTHTLGFGFRILAPQISSQLFRIDFGFPIYGRGQLASVVVPSFGIGQAF